MAKKQGQGNFNVNEGGARTRTGSPPQAAPAAEVRDPDQVVYATMQETEESVEVMTQILSAMAAGK